MKKLFLLMMALLPALAANAKIEIDFSDHFDEGTNTITCVNAWEWHNPFLTGWDIEECDYLYLDYSSTCSFNLILQNESWQNAYQLNCASGAHEVVIPLTDTKKFSCLVIQNHAPGEINVNQIYFCTEHEYLYPEPTDMEEARENLSRTYMRYLEFSYTITPGDAYGQYPQDLYDAFQTALDKALILDDYEQNYGYNLSVDEINALSHAIVKAYLALKDAKISYLPADGYYRFVCARQFYTADEETGDMTFYTKAMYSKPSGENGWKNLDLNDPTFLWQIQRQENNTYLLTNPANGLTFTSATNCTDGKAYIAFDPISKEDGTYITTWDLSTEEDITMFNFRMSGAEANAYQYVHMNWHNQGTGWEGPLTVWCNTTTDSGASEWYLEPVSEEDALALINDRSYVRDFTLALDDAKAKVAMASAMLREVLITDADQFSSPYSQNDMGNPDGGNLAEGVLIDGRTTYWHTYWEGGNAEPGVHYLQVELPEAAHGLIELDVTRRGAPDDNVTRWGIYGSEYDSGEKFDFEWIADVDMPYNSQGESKTATFTIPEGTDYKYLRFYAEATNSNRGYWHVAEFQLVALSENPNSQAVAMGDVYTNMVNAIASAEAIDMNNLTRADYETFKAAYDPFIAMFVDPSALNNAIVAAQQALPQCVEGNNPGQWSAEALNNIEKTIKDAKAYVQAGKYTKEKVDEYLALLGNGNDMVMAAANRVKPGKLYTIRFAPETLYDERGWSTSNVFNDNYILFDTYLSPADEETLMTTPATDVRMGNYMFFTNDAEGEIAFRFVPVGENTYMIQHQASGLYIQCYGYDSWTGLTLNPTLFTVNPVGYGENIIRGVDFSGKDMACLHAQLNGQRLVTWHDDYVGCNSGLIIEELGDDDLNVGTPQADFKAGDVTTFCYPLSIQPSEGAIYTVAGTYTKDEKVYVALNKVEKAEAGQPVVYVAEGTYNEESEDDIRTVALTAGTELVTEPLADGALRGTYNELDLTEEAILFAGGKCELSSEENKHVWRNHAYLPADAAQVDADGTYSLVLEVGGDLTGIRDAVARVSTRGTIYDAAGRVVQKSGTLNDLQSLPRGLYILNGTKILVK